MIDALLFVTYVLTIVIIMKRDKKINEKKLAYED